MAIGQFLNRLKFRKLKKYMKIDMQTYCFKGSDGIYKGPLQERVLASNGGKKCQNHSNGSKVMRGKYRVHRKIHLH